MAVGWDYTAGLRGSIEGARIASARGAQEAAAMKQSQNQQRLARKAKEDEERAALAQQRIIDQQNQATRSTFYKGDDPSQSAGLNNVFDHSKQKIVDTYTRIKSDKDMDPGEQALMMRKITNQIPLLNNAKAKLDANMKLFAKLSESGEVSRSMDPKYQYVYQQMAEGNFDGNIDFDGDDLVFNGVMPDGEAINLPLRDFDLHLPGVEQKGISLTDSADAYADELKLEIDTYRKDGKKRPDFDRDAKKTAILSLVEGNTKSGNELFAYGMDTMNYSREEIQERVDALKGTIKQEDIISKGTYERLKARYAAEDPPREVPKNLMVREEVMTEADARIEVMDQMMDLEVDVLEEIYNASKSRIQRPQVTSYTQNIIEDVVETSDDTNASPLQGSNMDLKPGDFSVKKVTGYDTNATNLKEGFNADGEYIVSYDQVNSKFGDQPPVTTEYNLNTESGARRFLLNRYLNEQGGLTPSAKEKAEAKKLAYKNAPKLIEQMQQNYLNIMGPVKGVKPPSGSAFSTGTRSEAQDLINKYGKQQ